jgi:hypothetical protein
MLHAQAFVETALLAKASVSHDNRVFTFATPDPTKPLGLVTCGCILAGGGKGLGFTSALSRQRIGPFSCRAADRTDTENMAHKMTRSSTLSRTN